MIANSPALIGPVASFKMITTIVMALIPYLDWVAVITAVATFGYAAHSDIRTRRIRHAVWKPAAVVALALLVFRSYHVITFLPTGQQQLFAIRVTISIVLVGGLGYGFYFFRLFGGADAKGMMVLSILLPVYPTFEIAGTTLPYALPPLGVFSLSAITNGLIITLSYPVLLGIWNALTGNTVFPWSFVARPLCRDEVVTQHGKLVDTPSGKSRNGLDLDALRMYLRWRGITLAELLKTPPQYRETAPDSPNVPDDGRIYTDGGETEDPWAAAEFLAEYPAYGTTPEQLRGGLEVLTAEETVWITDGLPLIVSFFVGILLSLVVGDLLFLLLPF